MVLTMSGSNRANECFIFKWMTVLCFNGWLYSLIPTAKHIREAHLSWIPSIIAVYEKN